MYHGIYSHKSTRISQALIIGVKVGRKKSCNFFRHTIDQTSRNNLGKCTKPFVSREFWNAHFMTHTFVELLSSGLKNLLKRYEEKKHTKEAICTRTGIFALFLNFFSSVRPGWRQYPLLNYVVHK